MEIVNETSLEYGLAPAYAPGLPRAITLVLKATLDIGTSAASLAAAQEPVLVADEYYDSDYRALRREYDVAPFKPRADILVVGRAYAPAGKPVPALAASVRVGQTSKRIAVIGDRHWQRSRLLGAPKMSDPEPFDTMDLVADRAFGGWCERDWCRENPTGRGFIAQPSSKLVDGLPLPNLENPDNPILAWNTHPKPTGFGVYPRDAAPRFAFGGRFPVDHEPTESDEPQFPPGFSLDFFNAAYPDLQVEGYLRGDEEIELKNLTPDGLLRFRLPGIQPDVTVERLVQPPPPTAESSASPPASPSTADSPAAPPEPPPDDDEAELTEDAPPPTASESVPLHLDTLYLLPDERRAILVWRGLISVQSYNTFDDELHAIRIRSSAAASSSASAPAPAAAGAP